MKMIKWWIIIFLVLAILAYGVYFMISNDDSNYPKIPVNSKKDTIYLTSNGCCIDVENVTISFLDSDGKKTIAAECEKVHFRNTFDYQLPDITSFPVELIVDLETIQSKRYKFSHSVMKYTDFNELKNNGVLVYIQEADGVYVNILSGENHIAYKQASENGWEKLSEPLKLEP